MTYANLDILKALRHSRGDSQTACAHRLGVTLRTVGNWERLHGWLKPKQMRLIYAAYHVTPQVAETITDQYFVSQGIHNAASPIIAPQTTAPETRKLPPVAATQSTKPHTTYFLKHCLEYPNTIIGFGPTGHVLTLHASLDRLLRSTNCLNDYHCDALIRFINGKRPHPGESLI